jgi:hypothetical protein
MTLIEFYGSDFVRGYFLGAASVVVLCLVLGLWILLKVKGER